VPVNLFSIFCIPALIFSIMTVMPSTGVNEKPVDHPPRLKNFNPLFFMHSSLIPMKVFEHEFERVMTGPQKYYGYMTRDIYIAGLVLRTKKYRYLRWNYQALLSGVSLGTAGAGRLRRGPPALCWRRATSDVLRHRPGDGA